MSKEFLIIEQLLSAQTCRRADVLLGIGDDGAVTRVPAGCDLVTATDALVEGTHFLPGTPARSTGHRCLAVNLSDLAAMAADPMWASLALSLPAADEAWLTEFAAGLFTLADMHGVTLIGGDTVRGALAATVTLQGCVPAGQGVARSGAAAGDLVYVTGSPGDAVAGRLLAAGALNCSGEQQLDDANVLVERFYYPTPRVAFGAGLRGLATAMIDVSDGLAVDLGRLLAASGKGAELAADTLPLSAALQRSFASEQAVKFALTGGDDCELCFTAPQDAAARVATLADEQQMTVTCLGEVRAATGLDWSMDGKPYTVPAGGFEHFT